jgi:recombination protein RecA
MNDEELIVEAVEPIEDKVVDKLAAAKKIMASLNAAKKKAKPLDTRPAVYIAGEHPELLDHGIVRSSNTAFNVGVHGGLRRGILTIFWGKENTGKSSAAYEFIAQVQKEGGVAAVVHSESLFPAESAKELGVNLDELIMIQDFTSGEDAVNSLFKLMYDVKTGVPLNILDIVVIDSLASLVPKYVVDKMDDEGFEAQSMGAHPKMITGMVNRIFGTGASAKTAIIGINQLREKIGGYGNPETQGGGHALAHMGKLVCKFATYSADRIFEGKGDDKKRVGHTVHVIIEKNQSGLGGHPGEEFSYDVYYHKGSDSIQPIIDAALVDGYIEEPSKAWFQVLPKEIDFIKEMGLWDEKKNAPLKIQGKPKLREIVASNEKLLNRLRDLVEKTEGI